MELIRYDQLVALGFAPDAIKHRVASGRLHPQGHGVYSVGTPRISRTGEFLAAVFACGLGAALSHPSAAVLWRMRRDRRGAIEVTIPAGRDRRPPGIRVHRRTLPAGDVTTYRGIPVTTPIRTLLDIAVGLAPKALERAVNEADKRDLIDPDALLDALAARAGQPGVRPLRELLSRHAFVLTDSDLEALFVPIARRAGLPTPVTQRHLGRGRVDFLFPSLGLVVETDGLRYHRTPAQQAEDRRRDQELTARGLIPLRFTHFQVAHEAGEVQRILVRVARRIACRR